MKLAFGVSYLGTNYFGWQKQSTLVSIQGTIEHALSKVADEPIFITGSGRTDTGVHASGQICHFETNVEREPKNWLNGANRFLPDDISLFFVTEVDESFHARFSAVKRHYRFLIYNHKVRSSCWNKFSAQVFSPLNVEQMDKASQLLLGMQDFSSIRDANCQSFSPIREVYTASVRRQGDFVIFDITANAFLHHMVRNIMGLLVPIGLAKKPIRWVKDVLEAQDRSVGGMTFSPKGLYLHKIDFNKTFPFNFNRQQHIIDLFD